MTGRLLHPFARPTADAFLTIVRGEGAAVFDQDGRRYVDGLASLWYCNVGHGRREIADAIGHQLATLENYNIFDIFTNQPAEDLAARIAELAPIPDGRVFFTSSGSEAVDTALKLARLTFQLGGEPDRHLLVGRTRSYHGTNFGGTAVQGLPLNQEGWGPAPAGFAQIDHDDLSSAVALFERRGPEIAAVLVEPVIGAGGVHPSNRTYLAGLRELCDEHGALLVFDEVITGFGRLGRWFAADHYGVRPDLITFAKAVTSGYQPLGGVIVGDAVRQRLEADPSYVLRTGYTYSGHPTACAAGLANLDVLADEHLLDRVDGIRTTFSTGLGALRDAGLVEEVRGEGAMWAVGLADGVDALAVRAELLQRGVIARPIGPDTVAFCPPLVIDDDDLAHCIDALGDSLRTVGAGPG
jgi:adenosylmethionine-8-amino-7-oxononanoate aminotransferase